MAASNYVTRSLGVRFTRAVPLVYVSGYPKSGTTWACQLAASYLQLPFPRYSLLPVTFPAVVHGHYLVDQAYPHCVYVMRDGRDVMTSLYYHLQRYLRNGSHRLLPKNQHEIYRNVDDVQSVRSNFPRFLETQIRRTIGCHYSWGEHVASFLENRRPTMPCLRYEELLGNGAQTLAHEMARLDGKEPNVDRARFIMDDYSFSRRSGRKHNQEDKASFLRKGVAGDWRNHFTREAAEIFDHFCGDALIAAGYEADRSWVYDTPASVQDWQETHPRPAAPQRQCVGAGSA